MLLFTLPLNQKPSSIDLKNIFKASYYHTLSGLRNLGRLGLFSGNYGLQMKRSDSINYISIYENLLLIIYLSLLGRLCGLGGEL